MANWGKKYQRERKKVFSKSILTNGSNKIVAFFCSYLDNLFCEQTCVNHLTFSMFAYRWTFLSLFIYYMRYIYWSGDTFLHNYFFNALCSFLPRSPIPSIWTFHIQFNNSLFNFGKSIKMISAFGKESYHEIGERSKWSKLVNCSPNYHHNT